MRTTPLLASAEATLLRNADAQAAVKGRHLAAVLAADMVGYARHIVTDEAGTLARLRSLRRQVLYPCTKRHGGRVVKSSGDGVLVEFSSAVEALSCAVEIQRAVLGTNEGLPESSKIQFRMGLSVGDVLTEEDGDILGETVNKAARLEAIAPSGGIALSRAVRDQVRDKLSFALDDMGEQTLKNFGTVRFWT